MKSTIKLFKALEIKNKRKKNPSKALLEKTIRKGFIFSPEVISNYSDYSKLIKVVEKELGLSGEQMNNAFHKSWEKIKTADIEQLVMEQIVHYITTYGFEKLGIYNEESVYIPKEKLEIPGLKEDIRLFIIKGYTKKELKEKLLVLLSSGIALKEDTINAIIEVSKLVILSSKEIDLIRNKEVKIRLYDELKTIPENPLEFLRYLVYKTTGESLLIKNKKLTEMIKEKNSGNTRTLLNRYHKKYGLTRLAEIFYRFKPIFLAFKREEILGINSKINKIRKLAIKHHKPMPEDYLNSITGKIKNKKKINRIKLNEELSKVNIFRKVRLAYALNYRTKDVDSILYKIRNGKGYAKEFEFSNKTAAKGVLKIVEESIVKDIKKNVKGKKIYIPEEINYALPATEKQFVGNFPSGTYVTLPKDMVVGVHWENVDTHRIDLDLALISMGTKIGWDSAYRTEERDILFSGDLTSAPKPNGAVELFYLKRQIKNPFLLSLNYYNYDEDVKVPFKILVAKEEVKNFKRNHMVNPNNVVALAKSEISQKQMVLGLLVPTTQETRFYFTEASLGQSITSSSTDFMEHTRQYLLDFNKNALDLKTILEKAGAKFVKKEKCEINLSPEELEKDSILNLLVDKK